MDVFKLATRNIVNGDSEIVEVLTHLVNNFLLEENTKISFLFKDKVTLFLNIQLPDPDSIARKIAKIERENNRLFDETEPQLKKDFAYLIHAIFFRIVGEVFSSLSVFQKIILSGCAQRDDSVVGGIGNEYVISVEIERERWLQLDKEKN